ncbi:hypothetical protein ACFV3R_26020 [Streptomyces sp. NPDC059740]|uniref:hypothetical protein n=1 Tax=Streptomyces sp. NPDC059740 TaxID=3346926 RepID=UPI003667CC95
MVYGISQELPAADVRTLPRLRAEAERLATRGRDVEIVYHPGHDTYRIVESRRQPVPAPA